MLPGIWMSVKQQLDVGAGFEDRERIVGIYGFDRGEPGVLHHIHRAHAQQHLVFDNQDGAKTPAGLHARSPTMLWHFHSGASGISPRRLLTHGVERFS